MLMVVPHGNAHHERHKHPQHRAHHTRAPPNLLPRAARRHGPQHRRDVQERPALRAAQSVNKHVCLDRNAGARTENSSAPPGHRPPPFESAPKNASSTYDATAPSGVDALNSARCFLHSARASPAPMSDVVSASAVGAAERRMTGHEPAQKRTRARRTGRDETSPGSAVSSTDGRSANVRRMRQGQGMRVSGARHGGGHAARTFVDGERHKDDQREARRQHGRGVRAGRRPRPRERRRPERKPVRERVHDEAERKRIRTGATLCRRTVRPPVWICVRRRGHCCGLRVREALRALELAELDVELHVRGGVCGRRRQTRRGAVMRVRGDELLEEEHEGEPAEEGERDGGRGRRCGARGERLDAPGVSMSVSVYRSVARAESKEGGGGTLLIESVLTWLTETHREWGYGCWQHARSV